MSKVDVIVPLYNVEKYIGRCIESILNQSFTDWRLILVDDGSTDGSGAICDKYSKAYEQVIVFHKENGGVSEARNFGIAKAEAEYVAFVDSDDFIDTAYLEILVCNAEKYDADVVMCGSQVVYGEITEWPAVDKDKSELVTRQECYRRMLKQQVIDVGPCSKLYRRSVLGRIIYPIGEIYEDMKRIRDIVELSECIAVTEYNGYYYYQHNESIMHKGMSEGRMSLLHTLEEMQCWTKENYPSLEEAVSFRYIRCCFHVINRAIYDKNYSEQVKEIREIIKKHASYIYGQSDFALHEKVACALLNFSIPIYKFGLKAFRKGKI